MKNFNKIIGKLQCLPFIANEKTLVESGEVIKAPVVFDILKIEGFSITEKKVGKARKNTEFINGKTQDTIWQMANHSIRVTKAKAEKQTIEQLALEVFAIIEGKINSHDFNEDDTEVEIEAEICIEGKDFGTVKFEVYQNILTPSGGGSWDEAPYGFEADYQVFDIETEIYNEGNFLPNVTKSVNEILHTKFYGKTI